MINKVDYKEYDLIGLLDDEESCLESFTDYSGYVGDAITELADSYIPIYNGEIWEHASTISEYIEEAIASGLADTSREVDLMRIFQAGYYEYYSQSLYKNLDTLAYNAVAEIINKHLAEKDEDALSILDFGDIEYEIEKRTDDFDNNNTMNVIQEIADEIIEQFIENVDEEDEVI